MVFLQRFFICRKNENWREAYKTYWVEITFCFLFVLYNVSVIKGYHKKKTWIYVVEYCSSNIIHRFVFLFLTWFSLIFPNCIVSFSILFLSLFLSCTLFCCHILSWWSAGLVILWSGAPEALEPPGGPWCPWCPWCFWCPWCPWCPWYLWCSWPWCPWCPDAPSALMRLMPWCPQDTQGCTRTIMPQTHANIVEVTATVSFRLYSVEPRLFPGVHRSVLETLIEQSCFACVAIIILYILQYIKLKYFKFWNSKKVQSFDNCWPQICPRLMFYNRIFQNKFPLFKWQVFLSSRQKLSLLTRRKNFEFFLKQRN